MINQLKLFQSTHSLRSATFISDPLCLALEVSIHALLAECDSKLNKLDGTYKSFNPRTPCGVRPALANLDMVNMWVSIHALLAECDNLLEKLRRPVKCFNPRTPCGVRHLWRRPARRTSGFNPRTPCGVRLPDCPIAGLFHVVSIHALLAECDHHRRGNGNNHGSFNPRTPCGVRQHNRKKGTRTMKFQSTHSLRSATAFISDPLCLALVSIHALLAECDHILRASDSSGECFNPRTPCGVRRCNCRKWLARPAFQSTHSLRSATQQGGRRKRSPRVSIHALLAECDP